MMGLSRRASKVLFTQWAPPAAYPEGPTVLVSGKGCFVKDEHGKEYLDALSGMWCAPLGYGRAEIVEAMERQLSELAYAPLAWTAHQPAVELAERLLGLGPKNMEKVFFCSGGSEGVDAAMRMARRYWKKALRPEREVILHRSHAFHGSTYGAASVTSGAALRDPYRPMLPGTAEVCQVGCCGCRGDEHRPSCAQECVARVEESIRSVGPERVAALIAEPVTAAGPVRVPPPGYWDLLGALLARHGILLILDEVLTGMGRTGSWFAASHWNIKPDLLILGKGLSGGYAPLGAVMMSGRIADSLSDAALPGYTFGGHPAACAAALAALDLLGPLLPGVSEKGRELRASLEAAAAGSLRSGPVQGMGLLASLRLDLPPGQDGVLMAGLREDGLLCVVEDEALCLAPPLSVGSEHIAAITAKVGEGLRKLDRASATRPG